MNWSRITKYAVVATVLAGVNSGAIYAQEFWSTRDGTLTLTVSVETLGRLGLIVTSPAEVASPAGETFSLRFTLDARTDLGFTAIAGAVSELEGLHVRVNDGVQIATDEGLYSVATFEVITEEVSAEHNGPARRGASIPGPGYLELVGVKSAFDPLLGAFSLASREVRISDALAQAIGRPDLAGQSIGWAVIDTATQWVAGEAPEPVSAKAPASEPPVTRTPGADMIFCQLYALAQYGREGDIVGLSVGTTAWNIGDAPLPWYAIPSENHAFIVWSLHRLKTVDGTDRLEQIGQSWIKHAFCALDSSQCTTTCYPHTGCPTLSTGCTDTYTASLNATQNGLGPRYELDAWNRAWTYPGSEMDQPYHQHDQIQHRCQVHDADLDPVQNPGATYYCQSFYVCPEDIDQMNSAAWKPVEPVGSPGGTWQFNMSSAYVMAEEGFAIDAWPGATKTILAQQVPVIEFFSPDGRCVLAAKATDFENGWWHYEYALLNVDMDRKVGVFSIPVNNDATVINIGFHAVESHDEPYSNDPWTAVVANGAVTWTTTDNPLRWGTLYNFRFDANLPPVENTTVTLGLYEPGLPPTVTGSTIGPVPEAPDCNSNGIPDPCDLDCGPPGGECDVPGCGGSVDCGGDGIPDECGLDCNENGVADDCDIAQGTSQDCNNNGVPDECEMIDCNGNGVLDWCDLVSGTSQDCNDNRIPDECDIDAGTSEDCNGNLIPDECEILPDTDGDGVVDCYDLCPETTGVGGCICPNPDICYINGIPIVQPIDRDLCISLDGIPDCLQKYCHDGCLIGDGDEDGDLDLKDFSLMLMCYSGPQEDPGFVPPSAECCFWFDFDDDADIDLDDYKQFQIESESLGPH